MEINIELTKRHFACRVYHSYFHYLRTHFPSIDLNELCLYAGLPLKYLEDESNWVSVIFDQKFTQRAIELTGQKDLCYRVGAQSICPQVTGSVVHFIVKNAVSVQSIYSVLPKLTSAFSKVTQISVLQNKSGHMTLNFKPLMAGLNENERTALLKSLPQIFQNTIGHYTAIPVIHGRPSAEITYQSYDGNSPYYQIDIYYSNKFPFMLGLIVLLGALVGPAFFVAHKLSHSISSVWDLTVSQLLFVAVIYMFVHYRKTQQGLYETLTSLHALDQRYQSMQEANENAQQLAQSYSRFVPWEVLQLLNHKSITDLKLGDHTESEMTTLFVDIRDFTALAEGWTPQETFEFLNSHLARVSPIIKKNGGFIDKFIGDGIMAIFPGPSANAINAAIEMAACIHDYNKQRLTWGRSAFRVGFGINTGRTVLGTIGHCDRMEGTAISDSVNIASRIEGLTKIFGAEIVIGEASKAQIERDDQISYRALGYVSIKGRVNKVMIYEVLNSLTDKERFKKEQTKDEFSLGVQAFEKQSYQKAAFYFRKVLHYNPADTAAGYYLSLIPNEYLVQSHDEVEAVVDYKSATPSERCLECVSASSSEELPLCAVKLKSAS